MSGIDGDSRTFRYPAFKVVQLSILPTFFTFMFVVIVIIDIKIGHYISALFFSVVAGFFGLFLPGLILSTAAVKFSSGGVSSHWCGICTQQYSWREVAYIREVNLIKRPNSNRKYIEIVKDDAGDKWMIKNAFGIIRITDYIDSYKSVVEYLNKYADLNAVDRRIVEEQTVKAGFSAADRAKLMQGASVAKL